MMMSKSGAPGGVLVAQSRPLSEISMPTPGMNSFGALDPGNVEAHLLARRVTAFFALTAEQFGQLVEQYALPEPGIPMANATAVFITFEGIEAAGKSTLIAAVNDDLRSRGENVLVTREPGGTSLGDRIRHIWRRSRERGIDPLAEALLVSALRAQHVAEVIAPAARAGDHDPVRPLLRCDDRLPGVRPRTRHRDAARTLPPRDQPDRARPDAAARHSGRDFSRSRRERAATPDRFELEDLAFHERVRAGYLELARRFGHRFVRLDGTQPPAGRAGGGPRRDRRAALGKAVIDGRFDVVGAAGPRRFFEHLTPETLSHGYLFAGPGGVGKKTFALRLGAIAALPDAQGDRCWATAARAAAARASRAARTPTSTSPKAR